MGHWWPANLCRSCHCLTLTVGFYTNTHERPRLWSDNALPPK
jgi:hypothetical protein